jgi:hypothetical protein
MVGVAFAKAAGLCGAGLITVLLVVVDTGNLPKA